MFRRFAHLVVCLAALVAVGLLGCGQDGPTRNLVIISMDTVRADHLGCYGYAQQNTPEIDALAARGALFENAMASSSWTTPSHASLFTGLLSSSHGAAQLNAPIRDDVPTLPEYLKGAGMKTAGFVTHVFVGDHLGFARGFDKFWAEQDPRADRVVDAAQEWIGAQGRQPFFAFLHLFDPHHPYAPPDEYIQKYDEYCRKETGDLATLNKFFTPDRDRALACAVRRYDDELNFVDRQLGRFVKGLEKKGLLKNTLVVITADHGEEFLDHGSVLHAITLYQEQLHVPLILVGGPAAAWAGKRVAGRVRMMDVMPTALELFGVKPKREVQAASLLPYLRGETNDDRDVVAETSDVGPDRMCLLAGKAKLIYAPDSHVFQQRLSEQFFDLAADPREQRNLRETDAAGAQRVREAMIAQTGYKWRRAWRVLWGGGGTEAARFGKLTTTARFIEGFKHLGVSSFDEPAAEAPLENAKAVADYSLRRASRSFEFSAKDHAQENGFAAIADPDTAPLHASLSWLPAGKNDPSDAQKEEFDLTEEIAKDKPRLVGDAFRVYSEPILTYPYVAPVFEVGFQKKMPPDLKKMLHGLGYF